MNDSAAGAADAVGRPGVGGGSRRGRTAVVALVCGVLPAALIATAVAVPAAFWSRLPGRITDHWTAAGTANGEAPRLVPFLLLGAIVLAGYALVWAGWVLAWNRARPGVLAARGGTARLIGTGLFMMCVGTALVIVETVANLGGGDSRSASIGGGALAEILGGPIVVTATATYLLRQYAGLGAIARSADGSARPTIGLRAGERAVWTGRARAPWAGPIAVVLVTAGAATGTVTGQWVTGTVLLVIGVPLFAFTSVRVRVAARGVTIGYGPLGLRLTRFPLGRIVAAEAVHRTSTAFGYRGSLLVFGYAAVILRRGPALKLTLRDGKTFLVTVDDAVTGAALLNDLLAARPAHPGQ